jgi:hypothetical protein
VGDETDLADSTSFSDAGISCVLLSQPDINATDVKQKKALNHMCTDRLFIIFHSITSQ